VNQINAIPATLLVLLGFVFGLGTTMLIWMLVLHRRARRVEIKIRQMEKFPLFQSAFGSRPTCWLAVRSLNPRAVQTALSVDHFVPCPWSEGMMGGHGFFIGPPVNGWVIVTGSGLPNPGCDADDCFHFLTGLSRKLGHVQFFQAERTLHHHAWVRVENGAVTRAYAWAGETVWNEGHQTPAEKELSMKCFSYGEHPSATSWAAAEWTATNVAKVPLLAARWSLDPARVDERLRNHANGVAGEVSQAD
jgi:hypothetical protein